MKRRLLFLLLLFFALPLWPQEQAGATADPFSLVGMKLAELVERFGPPIAVFAVRGNEIWQDDVVFQYAGADFFIVKDRVWQVKLASALGINSGDPKQAALLALGAKAQDVGDHLLMSLAGKDWPLMFRVNINNTGRVAAIFIYRPDF
ncbi:MAG: hypothetical protein LBV17_07495 [Treponema sp.]|jgi:hypothetical protein|nr:hypothetical protein [Treponema sp.]